MTKNKTQKPPRTIEEIVEDLRSKGELDEEKWRLFTKSICNKVFVLKALAFFSTVLLVILIYVFREHSSTIYSLLIIGVIMIMSIHGILKMYYESFVYCNYGDVNSKKIVKKKYFSKYGWKLNLEDGQVVWYGGGRHDDFVEKIGKGADVKVISCECYSHKLMFFRKDIWDKFNMKRSV